jgi:hypothetical protein
MGFKIHALVDRWSHLPLPFVITPARFSEAPIAPFLLLAAIAICGLLVAVVYADAAYFTYPLLELIRRLGAIPVETDDVLSRFKTSSVSVTLARARRLHGPDRALIGLAQSSYRLTARFCPL